MTQPSIASYHHWDSAPPDDRREDSQHWLAPTQRFLVEMVQANPGTRIRVDANPDEWCLIVGPGDGVVQVRTKEDNVQAEGDSFTVVPPGDSEIEVVASGSFFRLFSESSPEYQRALEVVPFASRGDARPIKPWPAPNDPTQIHHYALSDYEHRTDRKRIFQCTNFMVNMARGRDEPRSADDFSPHTHDDFEQVTLVLKGEFVHYMRRPWGKDSRQWIPDERVPVGAPSTTVIPPRDVHTLENVGNGPWLHADIFGPPREDFAARGLVLNTSDYPSPVEVG